MSKKLWFVSYGVDESHLFDSKCFRTKKEAIDFANSLSPNPIGNDRAFKIEKHEYASCKVYGDIVKIVDIDSNCSHIFKLEKK